jgi:hypothetical protein
MKATFNAKYLYELSAFAGDCLDGRPQFGGVCVQPHPQQGVILIVTDGARMVVAHDETGTHEGLPEGGVIVRTTGEKALIAACKPAARQTEATTASIDGDSITVAHYHGAGALYDGAFPDWRRVIPALNEKPEERATLFAGFNAAYVNAFGALCPNKAKHVTFTFTGDNRAYLVTISGRDDLMGVLMPVRSQAFDLPEWLAIPAAKKEAAAA